MKRMFPWRGLVALVLTVAFLALAAGPVAAHPRVKTLADGLDSPLGLAVDHHGKVYVTEAFPEGRISKLRKKHDPKVLYETAAAAVAGIAVTKDGKVVFTEAVFPEEEGPPVETTLRRLKRDGTARTIASLSAFEEAKNPDGFQEYGLLDTPADCLAQLPPDLQPYTGIVESNPFAVAVDRRGRYIVADAAGNTILRVSKGGKVRLVAVLPPIPQEITEEMVAEAAEFGLELPDCVIGEIYHGEAVPTDVEVGRDGHYYVTTLPGFPEAPGAGAVWRVHRHTGALTLIADGFSGAVDLALDHSGRIYVAELFANRISVIRRDGTVKTFVEVDEPGALEVGKKGRLYATTNVLTEGEGQVVRIRR